jgi:hypothetical protein
LRTRGKGHELVGCEPSLAEHCDVLGE